MNRAFFRRYKAEPDLQKRIAMLDAWLVAEGLKTQAEVDEVNAAATDVEKHMILTRQSDEDSVRFRAWLPSFVKMICDEKWHTLSRESRLKTARAHYEQHFPNAPRLLASART